MFAAALTTSFALAQTPSASNPALSANGLFVGSAQWDDGVLADPHLGGEAGEAAYRRAGESFGTGLNVQEVEVQLQSAVDPYFDARLILAIPGTEGLEVEEGYVTWTSVPRLLLHVGKLKEPFGRENPTHTHALLTIDRSLVGQRIFGGEGLNDVALHAQVLLPTPWFSEVSLVVDRGANDVVLGSGAPLGLGTMAHFKNVVDLGTGTTVELGLSGLTGANAYDGRSTVAGADLTFKSHGRGPRQWQRVVWQTEAMWMDRPGAPTDARVSGLTSTAEASPVRRWWFGGRFDTVATPLAPAVDPTLAGTALVTFAPTEFSALRLAAQRQWVGAGPLEPAHTVDSLTTQLNFTIGAHPAHTY